MTRKRKHVKEVWVKTYLSDLYEVSNLGRIRSLDRYVYDKRCKRFLKSKLLNPKNPSTSGYLRTAISQGKKPKTVYIHQLVYHSFNGTSPEKNMVVDHIDGNKLNNKLSNLQFITHVKNCERGEKHTNRLINLPLNIVMSNTHKSEGYGIKKMINKKNIWFGRYSTLEEAVARRDELIKNNWIK